MVKSNKQALALDLGAIWHKEVCFSLIWPHSSELAIWLELIKDLTEIKIPFEINPPLLLSRFGAGNCRSENENSTTPHSRTGGKFANLSFSTATFAANSVLKLLLIFVGL